MYKVFITNGAGRLTAVGTYPTIKDAKKSLNKEHKDFVFYMHGYFGIPKDEASELFWSGTSIETVSDLERNNDVDYWEGIGT